VERLLATAADAVPSSDARCAAVRAAINTIIDPCSVALAEPVGLVDLGLLERVAVSGDAVEVTLIPTSPHCLFLGLFEEQVEERLSKLPWVRSVKVSLDEGETIWDKTRMAPQARERLQRRRKVLSIHGQHAQR
jgi:metal-sulfur cluster biosynthetic enzyme